jgi:hypothetical protein
MLRWYYVDGIPNLTAGACCKGKRWGGECQRCMWHSSNGRHFISVGVNVIKFQVNSSCISCYLNTESHLTSLDCSICSGATSVCFRSSGWSRVGWGCFSWLRYTVRLRRFLNRYRLLAVLSQWPDLNRMKRPKFLVLGSRLRYRLYAWIRLCGWIRAICPDTVYNCFVADQRHNGCLVLLHEEVDMLCWYYVDWIPNLTAGACCKGKRWGGQCQYCMWKNVKVLALNDIEEMEDALLPPVSK